MHDTVRPLKRPSLRPFHVLRTVKATRCAFEKQLSREKSAILLY